MRSSYPAYKQQDLTLLFSYSNSTHINKHESSQAFPEGMNRVDRAWKRNSMKHTRFMADISLKSIRSWLASFGTDLTPPPIRVAPQSQT